MNISDKILTNIVNIENDWLRRGLGIIAAFTLLLVIFIGCSVELFIRILVSMWNSASLYVRELMPQLRSFVQEVKELW